MSITTAPTPKKKRDLHPRAQLKYHHTCANRAQHQADWLRELADRYADDPSYADYPARAALLDVKVLTHLRACVLLNDEHALGFPVTRSMRQTVGL